MKLYLIVILTLFSWGMSQIPEQKPLIITRPTNVSCTSENQTVGCLSCIKNPLNAGEFICAKVNTEGYYLNESSQAQACPRACRKCSLNESEVVCSECQSSDGNGFVPVTNDSYYPCTECIEGYALDSHDAGIQQDEYFLDISQNGICIRTDIFGNYSCQEGYVWDRAPGISRQCVKTPASCEINYSSDPKQNVVEKVLSNCNYCVQNYSFVVFDDINGNGEPIQNYDCLKRNKPTPRTSPVLCSNGSLSTVSCQQCDPTTNSCLEARPGYYLVSVNLTARSLSLEGQQQQTLSCPEQCLTCNSSEVCTSCNTKNSKIDTTSNNCVCANGYTTNYPSSVLAGTFGSYFCIKRSENTECADSYVWNSLSQINANNPSLESLSQCINPYNGTCYVDPANQKTSFWDRAPNSNRQCVFASLGNCYPPYAQNQGDPMSSYDSELTKNCDACITQYQLSEENDNPNNKQCVIVSSLTLGTSLILLLSLILTLY